MSEPPAPPPRLDPDALARAEAALDRLSVKYLGWVAADLERINAALNRLRQGDGDALDVIYRQAHDMKGQAATFGYPLITEIAARISRATSPPATAASVDLARLARLVAALDQVLGLRLSGDGGADGARLLAELDE